MNIVTDLTAWRQIRKQLDGRQVGFVPTMGNIHAGHLALCERSRNENDVTVVSIFVNPTQFNQLSDYDKYPRTQEADCELLSQAGVDFVFSPSAEAMYPDGYQVKVDESDLSLMHEGEFRPGHFSGMLTVVLKLLNLVQPMRVYFGEKDYQQLLLVKKMVQALFLPVDVIACETVRDADGLALSSRNSRLNAVQRKQATLLPKLLMSDLSLDAITAELTANGFNVEYICEQWNRRLGAVWLGDVRLIDNVSV